MTGTARFTVCGLLILLSGLRVLGQTPAAPNARVTPGELVVATLQEYAKTTGQDRNSVLVDYDGFANVPKLDRDPKSVSGCTTSRISIYRLRAGSAAIDRGTALPNINDGFSGKAPDLGALEVGQPLPVYGPQPR